MRILERGRAGGLFQEKGKCRQALGWELVVPVNQNHGRALLARDSSLTHLSSLVFSRTAQRGNQEVGLLMTVPPPPRRPPTVRRTLLKEEFCRLVGLPAGFIQFPASLNDQLFQDPKIMT